MAVEAFGSLAAEDPDDELARMYVGRTERYLTDPPGPDWLGVETYLSK